MSQVYSKCFIGKVDILGYKNFENSISGRDPKTMEALIGQVFDRMEQLVNAIFKYPDIKWINYQDGYVFYTVDDNPKHLPFLIMFFCRLMSMANTISIPLRMGIILDELIITKKQNGHVITGHGWIPVNQLEEELDWMGGVLYLPQYDGVLHPFVETLVSQTWLVKPQKHAGKTFTPPLKDKIQLIADRHWYLNWYKVLHQPRDQTEVSLRGWWSQIYAAGKLNEYDVVRKKIENTIDFADYCFDLREAAILTYMSGVYKLPEIGPIMN